MHDDVSARAGRAARLQVLARPLAVWSPAETGGSRWDMDRVVRLQISRARQGAGAAAETSLWLLRCMHICVCAFVVVCWSPRARGLDRSISFPCTACVCIHACPTVNGLVPCMYPAVAPGRNLNHRASSLHRPSLYAYIYEVLCIHTFQQPLRRRAYIYMDDIWTPRPRPAIHTLLHNGSITSGVCSRAQHTYCPHVVHIRHVWSATVLYFGPYACSTNPSLGTQLHK